MSEQNIFYVAHTAHKIQEFEFYLELTATYILLIFYIKKQILLFFLFKYYNIISESYNIFYAALKHQW